MAETSVLPWASGLPEHWDVVPLRLLARIGTGHTPDRSKPEYWQNCSIPWVTAADVSARAHSLEPLHDTQQKVSEIGLANSAAVVHPADTVMLCRTASVGLSVRVAVPMATTQAFVTWTCGPRLLPSFLLLLLRAMKSEWERLAYGSTHRTIYMPDLEALRVPVPPIQEQQQIVELVTLEVARLDRLVDLRQGQLALVSEQVDAVARTTLVDSRDPLTAGLPLRRILKGVKTGSTPREGEQWVWSSEPESLGWYAPGSFSSGLGLGTPEKRVQAVAVRQGLLPTFQAGSVLIVGVGATAGRVAYLDETGTGNQQVTALTPDEGILGRFLAWCLWGQDHAHSGHCAIHDSAHHQ